LFLIRIFPADLAPYCRLGDRQMVDQFSIRRPRFGVGDVATRYHGSSRGALPAGGRDALAGPYWHAPLGGLPKRVFDVIGASVALLLLAPLMLMVALVVRIVLGRQVIFQQRRVGFDGETFVCFKFRSMVQDADEVLLRHLGTNPAAAREWSETQKLINDPRVGPLGRALRKTSIDELPQLFNVLRGDMSLVGPRPVLPDELVARYGRYAPAYLQARPGMTGMWQVNGRSSVGYRARIARDRYYARHWSLALDLLLILKTIPALLNFGHTA
jgi:exopolysaccharide production protein ExoY